MKNIFLLVAFIAKMSFTVLHAQSLSTSSNQSNSVNLSDTQILYNEIGLEGILNYNVFDQALYGHSNLSRYFKNKDIITIVDFTIPSTHKRMYIIDLKNKKLLFHNLVSHGENSGDLYATSFSNRIGSHQSSLGFYRTENTYQGKNGYSLVINGLEKGINDNAKKRMVVIHGAHYCQESVITETGKLGTSEGCPAIPHSLKTDIINNIKNGTMLFIYANDHEYLATSEHIKKQNPPSPPL